MSVLTSKGLILVRTRHVDEHTANFAKQLGMASGLDVRFLVDERHKAVPSTDPDILSLNPGSYRALGLFTPYDVSWRCGDYGIYMAWRSRSDYPFFWLIEDDVRIAGDVGAFFDLCSQSEADFLATNLREANPDHHWWAYTIARDIRPYRCFFGAVRLSSEAVRRCYVKRMEHSRKLNRRALWPNDESLVATTVITSGLTATDFNELGPELYDLETFSIFGESVPLEVRSGPPRLIHPVRFGSERDSTAHRKGDESSIFPFRLRRAVVRRLNARSTW